MKTNTVSLAVVAALFALTGCVTTPTVTEEQLSAVKQKQEACDALSTAVEKTRCRIRVSNTAAAEAGFANPYGPLLEAKALELAERVDAGELTRAQGALEYQEYLAQVNVMHQQQAAVAAQAEAQRSAASAAMVQTGLQIMQPRRPLVTCNRLGSTVTCY